MRNFTVKESISVQQLARSFATDKILTEKNRCSIIRDLKGLDKGRY